MKQHDKAGLEVGRSSRLWTQVGTFTYSWIMIPIRNGTPEITVHTWWLAWERKDRAALEQLAREEYLEFTGHSESHRVGRNTLLSVAEEAFRLVSIVAWKLEALQQVCPSPDAAVAGYRWLVTARKGDGELRLHGVATDVLVREEDGWRYLSHHSTQMGKEAG